MKDTSHHFFPGSKYSKADFSRGVTFIELIVVISIFAIFASITLFRFSDFSSNITVQNLAQDIALRINQAEREAISGRSNPLLFGFSLPKYAPTYGVYFESIDTPNEIDSPGKTFIYFIDRPIDADIVGDDSNKWYDAGQTASSSETCSDITTECLEKINITTFDTITKICVDDCSAPINALSITFKRPFPDAIIKTSETGPWHSNAEIHVTSGKGIKKIIMISKLGQISVK